MGGGISHRVPLAMPAGRETETMRDYAGVQYFFVQPAVGLLDVVGFEFSKHAAVVPSPESLS
jgi:hypothetical protein